MVASARPSVRPSRYPITVEYQQRKHGFTSLFSTSFLKVKYLKIEEVTISIGELAKNTHKIKTSNQSNHLNRTKGVVQVGTCCS